MARTRSPVLGANAALIGAASASLVTAGSTFNHSFEVALDHVRSDPEQPRRHFDAAALAALAETLRSEGQLQPILLRPDLNARGHWIIVAGERRWRAAKLAGWTSLLAIAHTGDPELVWLLENLQRQDLSPIEEARGISRLLHEKGWTQEQAARALGKPRSEINGTLRILALPEAVLAKCLTSDTPPTKNLLIELSRISDATTLARLARLAAEGRLTIRAIRDARGARPAPQRRPARDPWAAVARAADLVSPYVKGAAVLSEPDASRLRALRDAIDAALARRS